VPGPKFVVLSGLTTVGADQDWRRSPVDRDSELNFPRTGSDAQVPHEAHFAFERDRCLTDRS
jgi:hypothetical protein